MSRPILRYHGGKWILAPWIISHFTDHKIYVEPFGGAASVLLRKTRSYAEIYNDIDGEIVDLFRVMRDPEMSEKLIGHIRLTPFGRDEYQDAIPTQDDDIIERSRKLIIRSFMGFGSDAHNGTKPTGFRANSNQSGSSPAHDWANYPYAMKKIFERLQGVVIENRPAIKVMEAHDSEETLHYLDPPYVHNTRSSSKPKNYRHEMTDDDHVGLLTAALEMKGMVIISGYPNDIYNKMLSGWTSVERSSLADGARKRTEVLWISPNALKMPQMF